MDPHIVPAWKGVIGVTCWLAAFTLIGWAVYGRGVRFAVGMIAAAAVGIFGTLLIFR